MSSGPTAAADPQPTSHTGHAPAKLILTGEHSVVYGHPALAVAVDRWTSVRVRTLGPSHPTTVHSRDAASSPTLERALGTLIPSTGHAVEITTEIPIGRGMGSSASLALATVRAWMGLQGTAPDPVSIHEHVLAIERVFHGTPSGVDHGVMMRGGVVRFEKTVEGPQLSAIDTPALPLVVFDTGVAGCTRSLVAGVRERSTALAPTLEAMGQLSERIIQAIQQSAPLEDIGAYFSENHRLLSTLGVSTPTLDRLVALAIEHGALGAKLSGAGGGGVVIALAPDPTPLIAAAERAGFHAFSVGVVSAAGTPS